MRRVRFRWARAGAACLAILAPAWSGTSASLASAPPAASTPVEVEVRHVSARHIYLDGGSSRGIAAGDTLLVERDGQTIARARVEFVAENSASCLLLESVAPVRAGDRGNVFHRRGEEEPPPGEPSGQRVPSSRVRPPPAIPPPEGVTARGIRTRGSAALAWMHQSGTASSAAGFDRPMMRLHLVSGLGGGVTARVRVRARRDVRSRALSPSVARDEWQGRLYALSLSGTARDGRLAWELGRFFPRAAVGMGSLDGAQLTRRAGRIWKLGAFAGASPSWGTVGGRAGLARAGAFVSFDRALARGLSWRGDLALVGEYHGTTVSREFASWHGSVSGRHGWSVSQLLTLDLDRGWRFARSGRRFTVAVAEISANRRLGSRFALGLAWHHDRATREWEDRSRPDSLFVEDRGDGLRARIDWGGAGPWGLGLGMGVRREASGDDPIWWWNANALRARLAGGRSSLAVRVSGTSSDLAEAYSPAVTVERVWRGGGSLAFEAGFYRYAARGAVSPRTSGWLRAEGGTPLGRLVELRAEYERGLGDDAPRHRLEGGLTRSF